MPKTGRIPNLISREIFSKIILKITVNCSRKFIKNNEFYVNFEYYYFSGKTFKILTVFRASGWAG